MKVLERSKAAKGFDIQIEDWKENYPSIHSYGDMLVGYPPSIRDPKVKVRVSLHFENGHEAKKAFKAIEDGEKDLRDYKEYFSNDYVTDAKAYMNFPKFD